MDKRSKDKKPLILCVVITLAMVVCAVAFIAIQGPQARAQEGTDEQARVGVPTESISLAESAQSALAGAVTTPMSSTEIVDDPSIPEVVRDQFKSAAKAASITQAAATQPQKNTASSQESNTTTSKAGWKNEGGKWYYYNSAGDRAANTWIGDYYVGSDGALMTSCWVDGGKYKVDSNGKKIGSKEELEAIKKQNEINNNPHYYCQIEVRNREFGGTTARIYTGPGVVLLDEQGYEHGKYTDAHAATIASLSVIESGVPGYDELAVGQTKTYKHKTPISHQKWKYCVNHQQWINAVIG